MRDREAEEAFADEFARCLLMPDYHVRHMAALGYDADKMAREFGVEVSRVTERLVLLGYVQSPKGRWRRVRR